MRFDCFKNHSDIAILFVPLQPFSTKCLSIIKSCSDIAILHLLAELFHAKCVSAVGNHSKVYLCKHVRMKKFRVYKCFPL